MTDLQALLLVLALIYGWECGFWLQRGTVAFSRRRQRGAWRLSHPSSAFGNQAGGIILGFPLPPLGEVITASQLPYSCSVDGVWAYVSYSPHPEGRGRQSARFLPFTAMQRIEAHHRSVRVNDETFLRVDSPGFALWIARNLRQLRDLPAEQRMAYWEKTIAEGFNTSSLRARWQTYQTLVRPSRHLGNALFVYLFVMAPTAIWYVGLGRSWPYIVGGVFLMTAGAAWYFRRAHKQLYPTEDDERLKHFLTILLSPASAIRAHDVLSKNVFVGFHPLTVAAELLPQPSLERFAAPLLRDMEHPCHPVCPSNKTEWMERERVARELVLTNVKQYLRARNVDLHKLLSSPRPTDTECRSYCPRCLAQFTTPTGVCNTCGGVPLRAFS